MEEIKTEDKKYIIEYDNLMKEWNWDRNNELGLLPEKITYGSTKSVWWKCEKGHEWPAQPNSRTSRKYTRGCPYCANKKVLTGFNDLQSIRPDIAKEWNYNKNGTLQPTDVMYGSQKKVWWKCSVCSHEWQATIDNRSHGTGCPMCGRKLSVLNAQETRIKDRGSLADNNPELLDEWDYDENIMSPYEITSGSKQKVGWICWKGHKWRDTVYHRTLEGRCCPICNGESKTSFQEQAILYYFSKKTKVLNREVVYGKEIDVYLPNLNIGIEYNGSYWHKGRKDKDVEKIEFFKKNDITIFSVVDGEINQINGNEIVYCKDLSFAITSLFVLIGIDTPDINIQRDRISIYEQYVQLKKDNSLAVKKPELAAEWHPTKNGNLMPDMFDYSSNKIVWWQCRKCGREWQQKINSRSSKDYKCRVCARKESIGRNAGAKHYAAKQVVQCDYDNNVIKIWDCAADVEKELKIQHSNIASCCIGKTKSAGGYLWYYLYDNTLKSGEVIQGAITQGIIQPHMIENNNIKGDKECNINYLTNL